MIYTIKFSHVYPKLRGQKFARLLSIELRERAELSENFIKYDTFFGFGESYPLPNGIYLILVFLGDDLIPFTTARRWTQEKERYYREAIGKYFTIQIIEGGSK
jgi:hypothetical protein